MSEMFAINDMLIDIRDSNILFQQTFSKNNIWQKKFKYHGAYIWNLIPNDIKNSTTIGNFKLLLKTWEEPKF